MKWVIIVCIVLFVIILHELFYNVYCKDLSLTLTVNVKSVSATVQALRQVKTNIVI